MKTQKIGEFPESSSAEINSKISLRAAMNILALTLGKIIAR
jgi:hypothetical protein